MRCVMHFPCCFNVSLIVQSSHWANGALFIPGLLKKHEKEGQNHIAIPLRTHTGHIWVDMAGILY